MALQNAFQKIIQAFDLKQALSSYHADNVDEHISIHAYSGKGRVKWMARSVITTSLTSMERIFVWVDEDIDAPHLVIEYGLFEGKEALGNLTMCPRADMTLDRPYLEKYFGSQYNEMCNECARRPSWRRFLPSQTIIKPMMAYGMCYVFENTPQENAFFDTVVSSGVEWWIRCCSATATPSTGPSVGLYDRRYQQAVVEDKDLALIGNIFGPEASSMMVTMTLGIE
jgi:hypothetical protein